MTRNPNAGAKPQPKDELPATPEPAPSQPVPNNGNSGGNNGNGNEPTRPWENVPTIDDYTLFFSKEQDRAGDTFIYRWELHYKGLKIDTGVLTVDLDDMSKEENKLMDAKLKAAYRHAKRKQTIVDSKYELGETYSI